jgi:hypothetical protein
MKWNCDSFLTPRGKHTLDNLQVVVYHYESCINVYCTNILKVLKSGAGEGRRRSAGPNMLKMKKYYIAPRRKKRNILRTVRRRNANRIGHVFCRNLLLKHVIEGKL